MRMRHLEPSPLGTSALGVPPPPATTPPPPAPPPTPLEPTPVAAVTAAAACRCAVAAAAAATAAAVGVGGDRVAIALRRPLAAAPAECRCLALELPQTCGEQERGRERDSCRVRGRASCWRAAAPTNLMMTVPVTILARGAAVARHVAAGAGFGGLAAAVPALLLQVAALWGGESKRGG